MIDKIESKLGGKGGATDAISQLKQIAQKENRMILADPLAQGKGGFSGKGTQTPLTNQQLIDFYKKNGFEYVDDLDVYAYYPEQQKGIK